LGVMPVLPTTVIVFVGMRLAAPILDPILFAVILALLFSPFYAWPRRRRSLPHLPWSSCSWGYPSLLSMAARRVRRVSCGATDYLCGLDAGDPPRDALACEPHRREWRGHRDPCPRYGGRAYVMNAESRFLAKVPEEGQSCSLLSG
jgi:hypothetical protein